MRALLFFIGLTCASLALAQFDMSNMAAMQARPCMALMRQDIKKELKLTKDQDKAVSALMKDLEKTMGAGAGAPGGMMAPLKKMDDADVALIGLLDDTQKTRLSEIRIQMMGPAALVDADLSKPLELSADQAASLKQIMDEHSRAVLAEVQTHHDVGSMKRLEKMRDARDAKLLAVLTEPQKAKFTAIQGKPFKNARMKGTPF